MAIDQELLKIGKILVGFHYGRKIKLRIRVLKKTFRIIELKVDNYNRPSANEFDIRFSRSTFPTISKIQLILDKINKIRKIT